jgi:hypothetical protein
VSRERLRGQEHVAQIAALVLVPILHRQLEGGLERRHADDRDEDAWNIALAHPFEPIY